MFEELRDAKRIAVDIETRDDKLKELGPGVRRGGYVCGVALGWTADGQQQSAYYPIRHEQGKNLNPDNVITYLKNNITGDDQEIVGTNLLYDLDFLEEEGVKINGKLLDVQVAEPLIDESKRGEYDLDSLSEHYLGYGKESDDLYQYLADNFGGPATRRAQAGRIWKAPGDIVEAYACSDVANPLGIIHEQLKEIERQNLTEVWDLERELQPMLLAMRRVGVRIDVGTAQEANQRMNTRIQELRDMLDRNDIVPTVASSVADYCDLIGIPYSLTAKTGQMSLTEAFLSKHTDNDVLAAVMEVRKAEKSNGTFIKGLLDHLTGEHVHCQFNQLNSDQYGTVSGRFSSSNPNLQNIPARDKEMSNLIRGLFIPEPGELWGTSDYSQIEYRMLVEYAYMLYKGGFGSREMMQKFIDDPMTDIHLAVAMLVFQDAEMRGPGKTINFGMVYGLGVESLIAKLGYPREQCEEIISRYHEMMPFAKKIYYDVQRKASNRGWIKTLGGRRRRFNKYEPFIPWELQNEPTNPVIAEYMKQVGDIWKRDLSKHPKAYSHEEALLQYANCKLQRSHTRTGLNALLQGSAADIMKRAMVDIWKSGVCSVLGPPRMTVHDELSWSIPDTPEGREAYMESNRIMEAVYRDRIKIPLKVDWKIGRNWAECK
jgi:DNA polymerase-1